MRGSTERTRRLRQQSVTTQPTLSIERALLETEVYKNTMEKLNFLC